MPAEWKTSANPNYPSWLVPFWLLYYRLLLRRIINLGYSSSVTATVRCSRHTFSIIIPPIYRHFSNFHSRMILYATPLLLDWWQSLPQGNGSELGSPFISTLYIQIQDFPFRISKSSSNPTPVLLLPLSEIFSGDLMESRTGEDTGFVTMPLSFTTSSRVWMNKSMSNPYAHHPVDLYIIAMIEDWL